MSYKVEITAATTAELAGKLLALAATMQSTPADPVMPEVKETAKPKKTGKKAEELGMGWSPVKAEADIVVEVAEEPVGEPETTEPASSGPTEPSPTAPVESVSASAEPLDFDKDVTPVVLAAVKDKGRDFVTSVLTQFGVERASQVPDEQFGELIALLKGDA